MDDPFELPPDVLRRVPLFAELSKVLSWTGGPVNWDLARQIAVSVAAGDAPASPVSPHDHDEIAGAVRVAELWLADTTGLEPPSHLVAARAATPADWAEHATAAFAELVDPIAAKLGRALGDAGPQGGDNPMVAAIGQMAPMFMGIQAGTIVGNLAREVTGTHDVGLPANDDALLLVAPAVDAFAASYGLEARAVRQWVALRAAAHRLAFEGFPWVRTHFFALYHNYVASLDVDLAEGLSRLQSLDLSDPSRLQDLLGDESLFSPQPSPATAAAAARLTTFLSVIEAHSDVAVSQAGTRAGDAARIGEAFARRRLEEGRGTKMLDALLGLDRAAATPGARAFVAAVLDAGGWGALNRAWDEPDAFPTPEELADPRAWLARTAR